MKVVIQCEGKDRDAMYQSMVGALAAFNIGHLNYGSGGGGAPFTTLIVTEYSRLTEPKAEHDLMRWAGDANSLLNEMQEHIESFHLRLEKMEKNQ